MKTTFHILLLLCLVSCSSTSKVSGVRGVGLGSSEGKRVVVEVTGVSGDKELSSMATEVRAQLVSRLLGEQLFQPVAKENDPHELTLEVKLSKLEEVSTASRVLLGALAGRNRVIGDVRLVDLAGTELRGFQVEGASASNIFSGEAHMRDAVEEFVKSVVNELR